MLLFLFYLSYSFLQRKLQYQLLESYINFEMTTGWATLMLVLVTAMDSDHGPHFSLI